jgi:molybdenum cofactor biosynthesis enzyme MoaA
MLKEMDSRGFLADDFRLIINSGEIAIHPCKQMLFEATTKYHADYLTNASIFVPEIAKKLRSDNRSNVNISLDSGTKKTFAKVKGIDCFERVCENIVKYGDAGNIVLKYILIPGVNDNENDFNGFAQICKTLPKVACIITRLYSTNTEKILSEDLLQSAAALYSRVRDAGVSIINLDSAYSREQIEIIKSFID